MSKKLGKCFGPSTQDLSFLLRCPSFLLLKFASQLKLIQSMVQVGIVGTCVTSSILRVLLSGLWVKRPKSKGPSSRVLGVRVPVPRSWVLGSQGPGSQVLILDYAKPV